MKRKSRRRSMSERMYDALNEAERVREDLHEVEERLYEVEERLRKVGEALNQAYVLAFRAPPGQKDPLECVANVRDWIRNVKERPASSQGIEATAVAVIERCAAEAGFDIAAVRERATSEVDALISIGDALAVVCHHGAAYVQRCRKRWKYKESRRKPKSKSKR